MARTLPYIYCSYTKPIMKNLLLFAFSAAIFATSCRTETIDCRPGYVTAYAVGFAPYAVAGGKMVRYVANTDTAVDSSGLYSVDPLSDTMRIGTFMPGFDYKLKFSDTQIYFISDLTLSGQKQQTIRRGFMDGKAYICTEQIISYKINGTRNTIPQSQQDKLYITR